MSSLFYLESPSPWMKECGITDDLLGYLQTAALLPESERSAYLSESLDEVGDRACILNALDAGANKGYLTPDLD